MQVASFPRRNSSRVGRFVVLTAATISLGGVVTGAQSALAVGSSMAVGSSSAVPPVSAAVRTKVIAAMCQGDANVQASGNGCRRCPTYTPQITDGDSITIPTVHAGAFVTKGASEAYAALVGCDSKPASFGGGVLLRQTGTRWRVVRYDSGLAPTSCSRFAYRTGTVLLACAGGGSGQGYFAESLGAVYIGPKTTTWKTILQVESNSGTCDREVGEVTIEDRARVDLDGDGLLDLLITVAEVHATRGDDCGEPRRSSEQMHKLGFRFDGVRFAVTPNSKAAADCLDVQANGSHTNAKRAYGKVCPLGTP